MPSDIIYELSKDNMTISEMATWLRVSKITVAFRCLYLGIREHEANEVKNAINKGIYIDTSNMTMGKMKLQRITALAIKKYYALSEKYSSDYVRNIHGVLNRAMRQAFTLDLVEMNVMDKICTPKIQKQEMMFWTFEEWTKFTFAAEGHVHYIVFSLGVYTGMRRGEILGLRWRDIDFDRGILTINQTLNWTRSGIIIQPSPKTATSNRQVKLDEYLVADLKDRKKQVDALKIEHGTNYEDHDLVCCYGYGGPIKPKRITEAFNVLTKKAGIKIRLHDLRHTYASFLLSIGINPKIAAERMGMSPAMFTSRYSHLLPNMQEDAVTQIEERIREGRKNFLRLWITRYPLANP